MKDNGAFKPMDILAQLRLRLSHLRDQAPHVFKTTQDLGRSGMVLARPVWADRDSRLHRTLEPLVATAAFSTLASAIVVGLVSLVGLVAAMSFILLVLHFIFGIKIDASELMRQP